MEMNITISLRVNVADEGANVNEICKVVKEVIGEVSEGVGEEIIRGIQEDIIGRLCSRSGRVKKKGLGRHIRKGEESVLCRFRSFQRAGHRSEERKVKTDIGELRFKVAYVECRGCGKRHAPVLDVLDLHGKRRNEGLERIVLEAVSETSYRRGAGEMKGRGCAPVPHTSAHRWAVSRVVPEKPRGKIETAVADGTGFKKAGGERGEIRVILGFGPDGKVMRLGTYAGKSWEDINKEVKKKLGDKQLKLFTVDGEPGLEEHLGGIAERSQRCLWHLPRDLKYTLWKDGVKHEEGLERRKELVDLLAVEIPEKDWEKVSAEEKEELRRRIRERESEMEKLIDEFWSRGYRKAAGYLENAMGRIFQHLELWLETGIIGCRTTSILENIMREIGRRIKKLGWNWKDHGAAQIARMVLMRHYEPEEWEAFWEKLLGLKNRCKIELMSVCREGV